jgi:hypothetical protein
VRVRATPLPIPSGDPPYFRVIGGGVTYYARTPSLMTIAVVGRALDIGAVSSILGLASQVSSGASILQLLVAARQSAPEVLALLGCLVGLAWADPVVELETPRPAVWDATTVVAYGSGVLEELHEGGWGLNRQLAYGLAVIEQLSALTAIEEAVQERARFFARPRGTTTGGASTPSAPSSAGESSPS